MHKKIIRFFGIIDPIVSVLMAIIPMVPFWVSFIVIIIEICIVTICIHNILLLKKQKEYTQKEYDKLYSEILKLNEIDNLNAKRKQKEKTIKYSEKREQKKDISKRYKNNIKCIEIHTVILFIVCVINCRYINTLKNNIIEVSSSPINEEAPFSEIKSEETELSKSEEMPVIIVESEETELSKSEEIPSIPIVPEETWVKFKLEYPKGYPGVCDDEIKNLYNLLFYPSIEEADLNEKMQSEILIWKNQCMYNKPLDGIVTSENKSTKYYADIELQFSNKNGKIMSSSSLDIVMNGRYELFEICPNGGLMWLLANHNQTYALNYLDQQLDLNQIYTINIVKSILYFYMKSIYCTQQSLMFDTDIETKNKRINYIKLRYKDIADLVILDDYDILDDNIRMRAYKIYDAM